MQVTIDGLRVVVTGGASGLGEAAVRAFVTEGAAVAVLDVQDDRRDTVVQGVNVTGPGRAVGFHCDVRSTDEVTDALAGAAAELGGIDALVNVAGIDRISPAETMPEEEWDEVVGINLRGTFVTNKAVFPYLRESGGGRILNFGSSAGLIQFPGHGHYVASKAGIIAWSRSVAMEWGKYGINVNSLLPFAETPGMAEFEETLGADGSALFRQHVAAIPAGRIGDPHTDIAPVLVFLLSDAARYITSQIIAVDGGNVPVR